MTSEAVPPAAPQPADRPGHAVPAGVHDVTVIGEALMDLVQDEAGVRAHPGGSPANVAVGLARLGHRPLLLTHIGHDGPGRRIRAHLESAGVALAPGSTNALHTPSAHAVLDETGAASYRFNIQWAIPRHAKLPAVRIVHTGSIGAFMPPGADDVLAVLQAHADTTLISVDANIRPALVGPRTDAVARFERLAALSTVMKMSDEDATWLYPGARVEDVVATTLGLGAAIVVVTRGAAGAILAAPGVMVDIPAVPVQVVDTIGAGDAFTSGMLHAIMMNTRVQDNGPAHLNLTPGLLRTVGRLAARAAAITVSRAGANPPTRKELDEYQNPIPPS